MTETFRRSAELIAACAVTSTPFTSRWMEETFTPELSSSMLNEIGVLGA